MFYPSLRYRGSEVLNRIVFISDFSRNFIFNLTFSSAYKLRNITRAYRGYRDLRGNKNFIRGLRTKFSLLFNDPTSFTENTPYTLYTTYVKHDSYASFYSIS